MNNEPNIDELVAAIGSTAINKMTKEVESRGGSSVDSNVWPRAFGYMQGTMIGLLHRLNLTEEQMIVLEAFANEAKIN